jgi:hypothetical protein
LDSPFDPRIEAFGEFGVVCGPGQFQADVGLMEKALALDLDSDGGDRRLKPLRGTQGDVPRWRGEVAL